MTRECASFAYVLLDNSVVRGKVMRGRATEILVVWKNVLEAQITKGPIAKRKVTRGELGYRRVRIRQVNPPYNDRLNKEDRR